LDIEAVFPQLVALRSLGDAADEAAVLHARVDRWTQAASGRRRGSGGLIAGLIPRARGVADPDMARALAERERAMETRARTLASQAVEAREAWVRRLGRAPDDRGHRARWLREVSTIAAYRDRWRITGPRTLGGGDDVTSVEQTSQLQRALVAGERARAMSRAVGATETSTGHEVEIDAVRGVER
jgi:hypothetical protein